MNPKPHCPTCICCLDGGYGTGTFNPAAPFHQLVINAERAWDEILAADRRQREAAA